MSRRRKRKFVLEMEELIKSSAQAESRPGDALLACKRQRQLSEPGIGKPRIGQLFKIIVAAMFANFPQRVAIVQCKRSRE